jgi:hypothetical protein
MDELLRRQDIQVEIDDSRVRPGYNANEIIRLYLENAFLRREKIDIERDLLNTTNEERKDLLRGQIHTNRQLIVTNKHLIETKQQLLLRLFPPPQMQAQPGHEIFL